MGIGEARERKKRVDSMGGRGERALGHPFSHDRAALPRIAFGQPAHYTNRPASKGPLAYAILDNMTKLFFSAFGILAFIASSSHCFQFPQASPLVKERFRTSSIAQQPSRQQQHTPLSSLPSLASSGSLVDGVSMTELVAYDSSSFGGFTLPIVGLFTLFLIIILLAPPLKGED